VGPTHIAGLEAPYQLLVAIGELIDASEHTQSDIKGRQWLSPELYKDFGTNALSVQILNEAKALCADGIPGWYRYTLETVKLMFDLLDGSESAFSQVQDVLLNLELLVIGGNGAMYLSPEVFEGDWTVWMDVVDEANELKGALA
jgi:hypothetical protein